MKNTVTTIAGIPTVHVNDPFGMDEYEVIDVRRLDEWNGELSHIKNSKLVTLGDELTRFLSAADRDKKILFVCRSGARSATATQQAMSLGFGTVFNMAGGMIYWNEKKFPIETTPVSSVGTERKNMKLAKNIHPAERVIRVLVGLALISLAFVGPENKWFLLGIVPVLTGFIGWCPPYQLLGISTCSKK